MGQNGGGGGGGGGGAPKKKGGATKWIVGCLLVLLLGGGCAALGVFVIGKGIGMGQEFCKHTLTVLQKQTVVVEKLGEPLEYSMPSNIQFNNNKGSATFPISGPKGTGTVTVTGTKTPAGWQIDSLTVVIDKTKEVIPVVAPAQPPGKK